MITIICLALAGFLIAKAFDLRALLAASAAVTLGHLCLMIAGHDVTLADGLMLPASLFALQGGFLIGCVFGDGGPGCR